MCVCALSGDRDGTWSVDLPSEEVPPELPEPCLGINFARDGMQKRLVLRVPQFDLFDQGLVGAGGCAF